MIKIIDIADEIYRDLGQIPDVTIPYITFWLQTNVGRLNNLISTGYTIDQTTLEIAPADLFTDKEKVIYKELYKVKFYDTQLQKTLYAGQYDLITEVSDGDGRVRKITRNDLAKTILQQKKDAEDRLIYMAHLYKYNKMVPMQVVGNDWVAPIPTFIVQDQTSFYY